MLDAAVDSSGPRQLLDVGTGTGQVVEALLGRFDDVIAIDNDPDMVASTGDALRPALPPGSTLTLEVTSAEQFIPPPGWHADLVTIRRTFHWLDQAAVLDRLDMQQRRAGDGTFHHHNRSYSDILRESPFSHVEEPAVPVHRAWDTDSILGYLYSTTFAAPHLFGDRLEEFDRTVRTTLAELSENDTFGEDNEFLIRIGRRPQSSGGRP